MISLAGGSRRARDPSDRASLQAAGQREPSRESPRSMAQPAEPSRRRPGGAEPAPGCVLAGRAETGPEDQADRQAHERRHQGGSAVALLGEEPGAGPPALGLGTHDQVHGDGVADRDRPGPERSGQRRGGERQSVQARQVAQQHSGSPRRGGQAAAEEQDAAQHHEQAGCEAVGRPGACRRRLDLPMEESSVRASSTAPTSAPETASGNRTISSYCGSAMSGGSSSRRASQTTSSPTNAESTPRQRE